MSVEIHVTGVSHPNADGTHRQDILAKLKQGDRCWLVPEPDNHYDKHAIRVSSEHGYIGYVPRVACEKIANKTAQGVVHAVFGGTDEKPTRGCIVIMES